jgi:hypothetical protein
MVACSTNGSVTSEILMQFLKKMDELDLFPRDCNGLEPFLLLDGHGSRLELPLGVFEQPIQSLGCAYRGPLWYLILAGGRLF